MSIALRRATGDCHITSQEAVDGKAPLPLGGGKEDVQASETRTDGRPPRSRLVENDLQQSLSLNRSFRPLGNPPAPPNLWESTKAACTSLGPESDDDDGMGFSDNTRLRRAVPCTNHNLVSHDFPLLLLTTPGCSTLEADRVMRPSREHVSLLAHFTTLSSALAPPLML